jgi:hypothetical protein
MSRFRSHWLALFGGVTLIALSLSTAFAAKPDAADNRGQQVAAFVQSLAGDGQETGDTTGDETVDATADDTQTTDDTQVETQQTSPSDHGACVALVAQDKEAVGPPNDNHGGAVSEAARVTCWETGDQGGDTGVEGTQGADASAPTHEHGKGHGHGHGA